MRILLASTVAASLALTGCTTNPTTGETQINKAVIGALAGAAVGAAVDKDKRGRGAAIGAVVGGGAGLYMEKQAAKMRAQTAGSGIDVDFDKATGAINLVMPGNITFDTNKSNIKANFVGTLDKVAGVLSEYPATTITVAGHTDNVGNAAYNQTLSQQRAVSVANYLSGKGISGGRLEAVGYGLNSPVASNDSESGRAQNRRVEISIKPTAQAGS